MVLALSVLSLGVLPLTGPAFLFVPFMALALYFDWRALAVLALALGQPRFGFGAIPMGVALLCGLLGKGVKELYARESRLARERQDLLQTLVHELRNPLFAAKGTIDNLSHRFHELGPEEMGLQLAMASNAMQSINQEVDDLTQLLRLESGRVSARLESVPVGDLFKQLRQRFPAQNIPAHEIELVAPEFDLVCDSLLTIQALDKLVGNAIVHCKRCSVRVTAQTNAGGHEIWVEDDGPGIPPEKRSQIFERSKQLDTSSSGFGLGLFLARQYVLAQAGELTLEESRIGCRFKIWLPLRCHEDQDSYC